MEEKHQKGAALEGKRFGKLTVLSLTDKRRKRSRVWLCRCDCGNTIEATTRDLNRGAVKSCGCLKHLPPDISHEIKQNLHYVDGTCIENILSSRNRPVISRTGVRGVYYQKRRNAYVAYIGFQGKSHYLGQYEFLHDAARARREAEMLTHEKVLSKYFSKQRSG